MSLLVLITGTGRSGTSTMSGSLHHLGLHVPGPYLGADESNPKGFFESKWSVKFHKRIIAAARITDFDGRPDAFGRAQRAITPQMRLDLVSFLREQAAEGPQLVVKDPRSVWAQALWRDAAVEAGLDIRYISMLRHPAEVIGSRSTYYAGKADDAKRRAYEMFSVGRWVNNSIISERETRGQLRAFVRYTDLLDDWRPVLGRVGDELGLTFNVDVTSAEQHPVDDFIDAGLRRHQVTWDDLGIPSELQDVAQRIWEDLSVLGDRAGADADASADLDLQGARYARILAEATAISHDEIGEVRDEAREAGKRAARKQMRQRAAAAENPEDRPLTDVGGRELARALLERAGRRLPWKT